MHDGKLLFYVFDSYIAIKDGVMGKRNVSIFFLLLIVITMVWTIYSSFFKERTSEGEMFTEDEFIDFLYQNLGMEEPHDIVPLDATDGHSHDEELETSYQPMNVEALDFQLKTIHNETIRLSELKGKKILLNFWTSWCPPCKEEMQELNEFYDQYAIRNDIEILAINVTDQEFSIDDVRDFSAQYQLQFPVLLDERGEVSKKYQIMTIPTSFIIHEDGTVIEKIVGPVTKDVLLEKFQ